MKHHVKEKNKELSESTKTEIAIEKKGAFTMYLVNIQKTFNEPNKLAIFINTL